jgi:hypothetical protein
MAHFEVNMAKVKEIGGGSVKTFCARHGFPRIDIYAINGRNHFRDGSQAQRIMEKLLELGVGRWVND